MGTSSGVEREATAARLSSLHMNTAGMDYTGQDSDSVKDKDTVSSSRDRRDVKLERSGMEVGHQSVPISRGLSEDYSGSSSGVPEAKPGQKTTSVLLD